MTIRKFTYPLKGNNDVASIRTKEIALEAFLNSLDLSDDPDDPSHDHDSSYAEIAHTHGADGHGHPQYIVATEGEDAPLGPSIGDVWIDDLFGVVQEIYVFTNVGWVAVMGGSGGGGGGAGPHNRHPSNIILYDPASNVDQWKIALNTDLNSLDFEFVG